jgi:hypothetical protein
MSNFLARVGILMGNLVFCTGRSPKRLKREGHNHEKSKNRIIFESNVFNKPASVFRGGRPKGFIPYEAI